MQSDYVFARDSICCKRAYAIAIPSVCLYVNADALHLACLTPIYFCLFADILAMGGQLDGLLPLLVALL